jgi:hypothetical protein
MQDHPSESFVARFESLAGTSTKRRVDLDCASWTFFSRSSSGCSHCRSRW